MDAQNMRARAQEALVKKAARKEQQDHEATLAATAQILRAADEGLFETTYTGHLTEGACKLLRAYGYKLQDMGDGVANSMLIKW